MLVVLLAGSRDPWIYRQARHRAKRVRLPSGRGPGTQSRERSVGLSQSRSGGLQSPPLRREWSGSRKLALAPRAHDRAPWPCPTASRTRRMMCKRSNAIFWSVRLRGLMDGLPVAQALRHSRGASIAPGTLGSNVGPGFNASPFTRGSTAATRWVAISIAACRLHRLALRRPGVGKAWFRRGERAAMWPLSRVERLEIKGGLDPPLPVRGTGSAAYAGSSSGHRFGGHRDCSGDTPKVHTADP